MINGRPIFCGGANWIPPELSLPRITRSQSESFSTKRQANMCMLRVWGGGIYESDDFYDLCDEKGVLVFQDFGFAADCIRGNWFAQNVAEEAREAVERLRHHPSLVLWAATTKTTRLRSPQAVRRSAERHSKSAACRRVDPL